MEGVNVAKNHASTSLNTYLGLNYLHDGTNWEVASLSGANSSLTDQLDFHYFGGPDPHYSVDRMSTSVGEIIFSCEAGYGRMIKNEGETFKVITSSIILGALADGDGLNLKPFFVSEMLNYFLGIGTDEYEVSLASSPMLGGEVLGAGEYLLGSYVEINAVPASGWAFVNWTNYSGMVVSVDPYYSFSMPDYDLTLAANFEPLTGLDEQAITKFSIYPNPVTDRAMIQLDQQLIGASYFIHDLYGKMLGTGILRSEKNNLDLNHLLPGVYVFTVGGNVNQSLRIIKL
ncbi:MAG: T9SS type A sorting domain-containing protein [Bacteroidales bacterium]|nr:T9SS type A sorting domain-containing protein [Bacteroidales bacterium]